LDEKGMTVGFRNERFHTATILDGEIVVDVDEGVETLKFLVFDTLIVDGKNLMQRNFNSRLGVRILSSSL
jgi:mRNA capping enzyme, catalytic domain